MPRVLAALLGLVAGYLAGAGIGAVLIQLLSTNTHDKSLELAMTAAFVTGPIGALVGLVAGLMWPRRRAEGR